MLVELLQLSSLLHTQKIGPKRENLGEFHGNEALSLNPIEVCWLLP
jgi:hypothetical protein